MFISLGITVFCVIQFLFFAFYINFLINIILVQVESVRCCAVLDSFKWLCLLPHFGKIHSPKIRNDFQLQWFWLAKRKASALQNSEHRLWLIENVFTPTDEFDYNAFFRSRFFVHMKSNSVNFHAHTQQLHMFSLVVKFIEYYYYHLLACNATHKCVCLSLSLSLLLIQCGGGVRRS